MNGRYGKIAIAVGAAALLGTWAAGAFAASPEEVAKCEAMIKQMGAAAPHSHGSDKGQGPDKMSTEHARCNAILAEASKKPEKK